MKAFRFAGKTLSAICTFIFFLFSSYLYAAVKFENPKINSQNKILFTSYNDSNETESCKTLFLADAEQIQSTKLLTCYPEKMEVLSNGSILQVRNKYGTARYSLADETLTWIELENKISPASIGIVPVFTSSSGKWLCFLRKTGAASASLVLKNAFTFQEYILDDEADFDYSRTAAKWCPSRDLLLYEKKGAVYFCDPKAYEQNMQMSDEFRKIGKGNINSVVWANSKYFIYLDGDLIYKISADELYTRALYSSIIGNGVVAGKLPLGFDKRKDKFWVSPELDKLALVKSNSIISLYKIDGTSSHSFSASYSRPFSSAQGAVIDFEIFWTSSDYQILWVNLIGKLDGKKKSLVYKISEKNSATLELIAEIEGAKFPLVSPDGRKLAFGAENHLYVYEIQSWKQLGDINDEKSVSYAWNGNNTLFAGGSSTVRKITSDSNGNFNAKDARLLFLSSVKTAFWKTGAENTITAQSSSADSTFYDYISYRNTWLESANDNEASFELMKKASVKTLASQNGKFRVYTGSTDSLLFENAVYVRKLTGKALTFQVFEESVRKTPELRRAALAFDALDNADGITQILSVLSDYKIKATFFLNGEFIKRYPEETRQILACGHECASMFFTASDFHEKGFIIDEDFIRRGLARNEDEFFAVTGSELSLLWHAPYYSADWKIKSYGELSGYRYIDMGRMSLDTATLEDSRGKWYLSAGELVDFYVSNAQDKMIIPVSTGVSKGTRDDYLYEKLPVLITSLQEKGFSFTLVRDL